MATVGTHRYIFFVDFYRVFYIPFLFVPVSFLSAQNIVYAGEEVGLSRLAFKAKQLGNKYVTIDRNIYYQALNNIAKGRRLDYSIQRSAKLNLLGIRYEKEGNIERKRV